MTVVPTAPAARHHADRWKRGEDDVVTGLVVTADTLRRGPDAVLELLLHEAAHLLCWTRGIVDTSMRGGAYHNTSFLAAAEEVGLIWPEGQPRSASVGFADAALPADVCATYDAHKTALEETIPLALPHMHVPEAAKGKTPNRRPYQCGCPKPRKIQVSATVAALGPIICGVCETQFTES